MDYRERLYSRYQATHVASLRPPTEESLRYEARVLAKSFGPLLPRDRSAAIFEIGCGSGAFLLSLKVGGYLRAEGMDQDEGSVAAAARLGVAGASRGDAVAHLAAGRARYDCVAAIDVVEHFRKEELFPLADAVLGALKPGGTFLWRAPNADGLFPGRVRYGDLTHELAFTRASAWQFMRAAGFDEVVVLPEEPVVTGVRSLLRSVLWASIKIPLKAYLFAESYAHRDCLLTPNLIVRARKAP